MKSHLDQLDQRISELKLDVSKTSSEYLDSDSRPSSGNVHPVLYFQECGASRTEGCQPLSKTCVMFGQKECPRAEVESSDVALSAHKAGENSPAKWI